MGFRKNQPIVGLVIITMAMLGVLSVSDRLQTLWIKATGAEASLVIDLTATPSDSLPYWQNLSQGGESPSFRLQPIIAEVKELKPSYIRLDHIFDFYTTVTKNQGGELSYDFTQLDLLLNDIISSGARPFLSLSYMPSTIAPSLTDEPASWEDWQNMVQALAAHVSSPAGLNLAEVYYEVWNEPDYFGQWKAGGGKNYFDLYAHTARALASMQNLAPYKIGGPATTSLYPNWVRGLLSFVSRENLRLDFYSWHHYSTNPEDLDRELREFQQLAKPFPNLSLEVIVSEWGHESELDPGYDGPAAAAHTVATLASIESPLHRLFSFEIQDGANPDGQTLWGRWGVISADATIKKPRYHALKLANLMQYRRLPVIGNGTWVKAIAVKPRAGSVRILITNYDPEGKHVENTPVSVTNLRPGRYQFTRAYLNRSPQTSTVTVPEKTYSFTQPLDPNTIAFIELTPLEP